MRMKSARFQATNPNVMTVFTRVDEENDLCGVRNGDQMLPKRHIVRLANSPGCVLIQLIPIAVSSLLSSYSLIPPRHSLAAQPTNRSGILNAVPGGGGVSSCLF